MIGWDPNNAFVIGRWSICGGGRLERLYCIYILQNNYYIKVIKILLRHTVNYELAEMFKPENAKSIYIVYCRIIYIYI